MVEEDHLLLVGLGVVEVHQKVEEEVGDHYQGEVVEDHLKEVVGLQKEEEVGVGPLKVEEGPLAVVELQLAVVEVELQKEE